MDKSDFLESLPSETDCVACGADITGLQWQVAAYGDQWYALCLMRCNCSWFKCAAAGSDDESYAHARSVRAELLHTIGK